MMIIGHVDPTVCSPTYLFIAIRSLDGWDTKDTESDRIVISLLLSLADIISIELFSKNNRNGL